MKILYDDVYQLISNADVIKLGLWKIKIKLKLCSTDEWVYTMNSIVWRNVVDKEETFLINLLNYT